MSYYRFVWSFALVAFVLSKPSTVRSQDVSFERDIRPILRQYCFDCHGATEKKEGKLDLRLVRLMKLGGDSGPAIAQKHRAGRADARRQNEYDARPERYPGPG